MADDTRKIRIVERARELHRDQCDGQEHDGQEHIVPELYVKRAEQQLIAEGAIQPKAILVEKLTAQNDV